MADEATQTRKRKKRSLPKFLRPSELDRLEENARSPRDRMIIRFGRFLGLRVSEIVKLRVDDVDLEQGIIAVLEGKGGKDRNIPIPSRFLPEVEAWVKARGRGYLFPSPRKKNAPLTTRAVQYLVEGAALRGDVRRIRVSPHKLRHSFATAVLASGGDIREVQELLGHANIATTTIYAAVMPERLRAAVDRL